MSAFGVGRGREHAAPWILLAPASDEPGQVAGEASGGGSVEGPKESLRRGMDLVDRLDVEGAVDDPRAALGRDRVVRRSAGAGEGGEGRIAVGAEHRLAVQTGAERDVQARGGVVLQPAGPPGADAVGHRRRRHPPSAGTRRQGQAAPTPLAPGRSRRLREQLRIARMPDPLARALAGFAAGGRSASTIPASGSAARPSAARTRMRQRRTVVLSTPSRSASGRHGRVERRSCRAPPLGTPPGGEARPAASPSRPNRSARRRGSAATAARADRRSGARAPRLRSRTGDGLRGPPIERGERFGSRAEAGQPGLQLTRLPGGQMVKAGAEAAQAARVHGTTRGKVECSKNVTFASASINAQCGQGRFFRRNVWSSESRTDRVVIEGTIRQPTLAERSGLVRMKRAVSSGGRPEGRSARTSINEPSRRHRLEHEDSPRSRFGRSASKARSTMSSGHGRAAPGDVVTTLLAPIALSLNLHLARQPL